MISRSKIGGGGIVFAALAFMLATTINQTDVVWTADSVVPVQPGYVTELGTAVSGVPLLLTCDECGTATKVEIEGTSVTFTGADDTVSFHVPPSAVGTYLVKITLPNRTRPVDAEFHVQGCDVCTLADGCLR